MKVFILCLIAFIAVSSASNIPTSFDTRKEWKGCEYSILDQHHCGGCWAFCSAESFADRLCISKDGANNTIISPEVILECSSDGCGGGSPHVAWDYMIDNTITTCTDHCKKGCQPFDSASGSSPKCHHGTCDDGSKWKYAYKARSFHYMNTTNGDYKISDVQNHLMKNGPMGASFAVYSNFHSFFDSEPNGIYNKTSGSQSGRHCVKLMGWGHESGMDYWLFANSWGTDWAMSGYFKMKRGVNLCGIEEKFSEGFTKDQHSSSIEDKKSSILEDVKPDGGWEVYETSEELVEFEEIAREALMLGYVKETKYTGPFVLTRVATQVVAGVKYQMDLEIGEEKFSLTLWRDPSLKLHALF